RGEDEQDEHDEGAPHQFASNVTGLPRTQTCDALAPGANADPWHRKKVAALPASIEPIFFSSPRARAAWTVTAASAWSSLMPQPMPSAATSGRPVGPTVASPAV